MSTTAISTTFVRSTDLGFAATVRAVRVEPVYPRLGQWVATLRKRKGFSQQELAGQLSPPLTRASIANIESGRQRLMVHVALEICRALEITPDELLSDFLTPTTSQVVSDDHLVDELARKLAYPRDQAKALMKKLNLPKG